MVFKEKFEHSHCLQNLYRCVALLRVCIFNRYHANSDWGVLYTLENTMLDSIAESVVHGSIASASHANLLEMQTDRSGAGLLKQVLHSDETPISCTILLPSPQ